jgi:hypothetical protein
VNRPQPEITVHPGLLLDEYREVVAHLGEELIDLGHSGLTLNPFHPDGHELVTDDPTSAGDSR